MPGRDTQGSVSSLSTEDFPLYFGDWLKQRRKQRDLTQTELAGIACCSVFALRKIEAGERRPSKQLAEMLAKALEIPLEDQTVFIKVARGELGVEKLHTFIENSQSTEKASLIPGNLPRALTPFIGREPELNAIAQLLHDPQCSMLTIVGPGGIGKTRLAIEIVRRSEELFPDGLWFIPLASLNSPDLIVPVIADAVGFKFQDSTNLQGQLIRYLRLKKALLVLDNFEHLLEGAEIFTRLLDGCQQLKLLVTSRERLNLLSEWVFEIQGLPVPPDDQVKQFEAYSSVALFLQSARRVMADFKLRDDEYQWIVKICQIMEGLPLGIELSAAWVGLLSIEEIAKEIEHNLDFLSVSMRDLPERHRSLRATLDHSWKLLSTEEKLILSRLSVFRGSFRREAAGEICEANLAVLSSLKNKTLLYRDEQNYYALHEMIRQYAGQKLAEQPDEHQQIQVRHAFYFVQYLSNCEEALKGSQQAVLFDEMARIIDDLSSGWQYMISQSHPNMENNHAFSADLLHSALFSLSLFYEMRCRSLEAIPIFIKSIEYLNSAQAEYEGTEDISWFNSILGHVTAYLGLHHYYIHQYDAGVAYLEAAISRLGDKHSIVRKAQAMVMLAGLKSIKGEFHLAAELEDQSREVFREAGEEWWYALSCISHATTLHSLGNLKESEALYQEASQLVKPEDLRLKIPLTAGFAYLLLLQNDFSRAEQLLQDALPLCNKLRDVRAAADIMYYLGRVSYATNRFELAESYFQKCIKVELEFGESFNVAAATLHLGNCFAARGDRISARHQFQRVIRIGQELNQFHLVYYALVFAARMYMTEGHMDQALEIYLLLRRCPIEYKRMQDDFNRLHTDLQAAFTKSQMDAAMQRVDGNVSLDRARAEVLAYVREHESG